MAEGTGGAQAGGGHARRARTPEPEPEKAKRDVEPTSYVILKREHAVSSSLANSPQGDLGEVWKIVDEQAARTQSLAIEAYTGKGDGAKVGVYRAVAMSAWKGAEEVKPPKPVLEDVREALD